MTETDKIILRNDFTQSLKHERLDAHRIASICRDCGEDYDKVFYEELELMMQQRAKNN